MRLRKPAYGTAEVRAIDREDLELAPIDIAHPAWKLRGVAVGMVRSRVPKRRKARLAGGKLIERAKRNPWIGVPSHWREDIADDWNPKQHAHRAVERRGNLHKTLTSGKFAHRLFLMTPQ